MRQYPLLNFTMAKSACAGAVAVRPSTSAPIAKRNFFIAHSPLCDALLPPHRACLTRSEGTFSQRPPTENVTTNQGHKDRVLEVMIERISSAKAFNCTPSERTKSFGTILLCRAEYLPKIFGEKLAEAFGR